MFTGIIEELGIIQKIEKSTKSTTFTVQGKNITKNKKVGDSISVNGACVTITDLKDHSFSFDAIEETLKLTNFSDLKEGSEVNLESALTLEKGIDGHLVQGHIDQTTEVIELKEEDETAVLSIKLPVNLQEHISLKGSITINGVSLTISDLRTNTFSVSLIPHTLKNTNLKNLKKDDKVNIEIDLISRYLQRLLDAKEQETKYAFLKERNLI